MRTSGGLRKTAVVITEEQYQELIQLATDLGTTRSVVVRRALEVGLKGIRAGVAVMKAVDEAAE